MRFGAKFGYELRIIRQHGSIYRYRWEILDEDGEPVQVTRHGFTRPLKGETDTKWGARWSAHCALRAAYRRQQGDRVVAQKKL